MKKIITILLLTILLIPIKIYAEDKNTNLAENAKSAILIESSTGKIIFEKNYKNGLDYRNDQNKFTKLHFASKTDNLKMGQFLISKGEDINAKDIIY